MTVNSMMPKQLMKGLFKHETSVIQMTRDTPSLSGRKSRQRASRAASEGGAAARRPSEADVQREYEESKRQITELQAALQAVDGAIKDAEAGLDQVPRLPSSEPSNLPGTSVPQPMASKLEKFPIRAAQAAAGLLLVYGTQIASWPLRILLGAIAGAAMGLHGYSRGSLDQSGGIAAAIVGGCTLTSSLRGAMVLLTFFFTSSKLTTYCQDRKLDDEEAKEGGQRNWRQVLCNGLVPSLLLLTAARYSNGADLLLRCATQDAYTRRYIAATAAFLGYYSCCCGDTWASEVGQLSEDTPRLITSLRPVRKGTNGGVTKLGLLASISGGLCMGLIFYLGGLISPSTTKLQSISIQATQQLPVVLLGLFGGLIGSLIDSILGATLQFTGYNRNTQKLTSKTGSDVTPISGLPLLSNNAVNLISASLTALLTSILSLTVLGHPIFA